MSSDEKGHETQIGHGEEGTGVLDETSERVQQHELRGSSSSTIPVGRADISSSRKRKSNDSQLQELIFPKRLMAILSDPANADCIRWGPDGSSFFILDKDIFARKIMPRLSTRRAKFSSFVRKLNRWGFSFVTKGPATGHYRHDYFHRDKPFLVSQMYYHNSRAKEALKGAGRSTSTGSGDEKQGNQVCDDNKISSDRSIPRDAIERQLMASSSRHNYNVSPATQAGLQSSTELNECSENSVVVRQRSLVDHAGQLNMENPVFAEQATSLLHYRLNPTGANTPSLHRSDIRDLLIDANDGGAPSNYEQDARLRSWNNHSLGVVPGSSRAWPNFGVAVEQRSFIMQGKETEFTPESLSQSLVRAPVNPLVILNDPRLQQEGNLHLSGLASFAGYNDPRQFLAPHQHNNSGTNHDERMGQFNRRVSGSALPHLGFPGIHTPIVPGDRLPLSLDSSDMLHPSSTGFSECPQLTLVQQSMMGLHNHLQGVAVRPTRLAETSLLNLDLRPFLPSSMYPTRNSQPCLQHSDVRYNDHGEEPSVRRKGTPGSDDENLSKRK